ncbi:MAG: hypothetical protein IKU08_09125 [Clostridia bacterium]|nr:hypothetical protein [Clostridia bacterium]
MRLLFYKIKRLFKLHRAEKILKKTLKEIEAGKITPNEARWRFRLPAVETILLNLESEENNA